jgi:hypothetical protein
MFGATEAAFLALQEQAAAPALLLLRHAAAEPAELLQSQLLTSAI